jgi:cellobiose phosphorylase
VSEFLLGIKPQYDGMLIEPCIPAAYGTYKIHRRFRDAEYDLTIHYTGQHGSHFIPYAPGRHELEINL